MTMFPVGVNVALWQAWHINLTVLWMCENTANHVIAVCVSGDLNDYHCVILNGSAHRFGEIMQTSVTKSKQLAKKWFIAAVKETCNPEG